MEILLLACMFAYVAGAQSEQSKLGLSPAQRATVREQARHEKAVRKIAEKYRATPQHRGGPAASTTTEQTTPAITVPEAFRAGYRTHTPIQRVATPMGRRTGEWTARGVAWARDTGRGALREYRKGRKNAGHDDPAPVLVPPPPAYPPIVPPIPAEPPTVAAGTAPAEPQSPVGPADSSTPPATGGAETGAAAEPAQDTADTREGVGRMAADITYESVMDESDELSLMCQDDMAIYDRIQTRAEREIGRGDDLIAAMTSAGFGPSAIAWATSCKEQYQVIYAQLDDLRQNTLAQGEAVTKAKALLEGGQGVYADIALDMESVAVREAYTSDAVDAEDTSADSEIYETKAAA